MNGDTEMRESWSARDVDLLRRKCVESRQKHVGNFICWKKVAQFFHPRSVNDCKACWRRICDTEMRINLSGRAIRKKHQVISSVPNMHEFVIYKPPSSEALFEEYGKVLFLTPLYYEPVFSSFTDVLWLL